MRGLNEHDLALEAEGLRARSDATLSSPTLTVLPQPSANTRRMFDEARHEQSPTRVAQLH
jgi:hypothetical protein